MVALKHDAMDWLRHRLGLSELVNPAGYLLRCALLRARRPLCGLRRHRHWERETMLMAFASGKSRRCPACNRLVLEKQYRAAP